ncbi:hypothetical protein O181_111830 [Austropuccinia psidii MF-1]|uniref:Uncharacterized protein n=1 Tax=Austropuccinia psidii MF-1 TaxID=1389203 RepID=A0A9Q3JZ85_9BASI|nr:hypothetical protein [Austropuccinia psidii MF-1]
MPKEYDCNTHSQCQLFTPTFPISNLMPASYAAVLSSTSKQKLRQLPSGSDLPMMTPPHSMIQTPLLPNQNSLTFGIPHPKDPLLIPGTSLKTRLLAQLNPFQPIPLLEDCLRMIWD